MLLTTYATLCKSNYFGQVATNLCCALQEQPCHILLLVKFFQGVTPKSEISSSQTLYVWFYLLCPTVSAEPCYGVHYSFSYLILWARNLISLTAVVPLRNKSYFRTVQNANRNELVNSFWYPTYVNSTMYLPLCGLEFALHTEDCL